jgi:hypothetical protein
MSTCNRLDLQTLGSQLTIMPKNLPDHCFQSACEVANPLVAAVSLLHLAVEECPVFSEE